MDKRSSEPKESYRGRFGEGSVNSHARPTGSFRTQPSGTYKYTRTGSEYVPARGYIPPKADAAPEKKDRAKAQDAGNAPTKRGARRKRGRTGIIIGIIAAIIVIAVALILILGDRAPVRMMPVITPPETAAPADAAVEAQPGIALQVPEGASVADVLEDGQ